MKLFWDSQADDRPRFDVCGEWLFWGRAFSDLSPSCFPITA